MPPKKEVEKKKARRNKRKSRTEVESSPSSSDNESARSPSPSPAPAPAPTASPSSGSEPELASTPTLKDKPAPALSKAQQDESFHSFYLQQSTREFANDLDKLRSAGDFHGERSVQMLVRALGKGTVCFGEGERARVVGAGG